MRLLFILCLLPILMPSTADARTSRNQRSRIAQTTWTKTQIRDAERRLFEMGYWTGAIDGVFDPATRAALIAFQKWEGRPVSGKLTIDELEAIRISADLKHKEAWPNAREVGYTHAEVDLDRQVMLIVNEAGGVRALPVSTGSGKPFMEEGQESIAYTPRGRFLVYDKSFGWETGALGSMYYSNYISGGVAIHGHPNVPNEPASHGCIRIPMFAAREVSRLLKLGTIVLVYDKVTFVSAKEWVANPELKRESMLRSAHTDYDYQPAGKMVIRKSRPKIIRAGSRVRHKLRISD